MEFSVFIARPDFEENHVRICTNKTVDDGVLKTCRSGQVSDMLLTRCTLSSTTDRCHGARCLGLTCELRRNKQRHCDGN